ncbi:hypothetical protein NFJ59_11695 [Citrobacter freundii]|nr:hypothetical protein [Citrobacter freundii]WFW11114.1 hypothetical protein NFJ59_11695 [Citrobacter freundii]
MEQLHTGMNDTVMSTTKTIVTAFAFLTMAITTGCASWLGGKKLVDAKEVKRKQELNEEMKGLDKKCRSNKE